MIGLARDLNQLARGVRGRCPPPPKLNTLFKTMTEIFFVRHHSSPTEIGNYEFIYKLDHKWTIEKILHQSAPFQSCNTDTIGGSLLEGAMITKVMFGHGDEPDVLTVKINSKHINFTLYRCHKEAQITFMTREQILETVKKTISDHPLLSLIFE
jgi:hypothetical protein